MTEQKVLGQNIVHITSSPKCITEKFNGELMGKVPRAMEIEYSGFDLEGNRIVKKANGLEARILQHEIDHLNGFLFFDHIQDKDSLTTRSELQAMSRS